MSDSHISQFCTHTHKLNVCKAWFKMYLMFVKITLGRRRDRLSCFYAWNCTHVYYAAVGNWPSFTIGGEATDRLRYREADLTSSILVVRNTVHRWRNCKNTCLKLHTRLRSCSRKLTTYKRQNVWASQKHCCGTNCYRVNKYWPVPGPPIRGGDKNISY